MVMWYVHCSWESHYYNIFFFIFYYFITLVYVLGGLFSGLGHMFIICWFTGQATRKWWFCNFFWSHNSVFVSQSFIFYLVKICPNLINWVLISR
jgi:hypothetical protein